MKIVKALLSVLVVLGFTSGQQVMARGSNTSVYSAHELEVAARNFSHAVHEYGGNRRLNELAHRLVKKTDNLHAAVERGAARHKIKDKFRKIERNYGNITEAYNRSHRSHHIRHFKRQYAALSRAMQSMRVAVRNGHRYDDYAYAGDRYDDGRYYSGYNSGYRSNYSSGSGDYCPTPRSSNYRRSILDW